MAHPMIDREAQSISGDYRAQKSPAERSTRRGQPPATSRGS
jgi:hypothetical protein